MHFDTVRSNRTLFITGVAVLTVFLFLLIRNSGLYPMTPDEYSYSKYSRLVPFSQAALPNYLYFGIYRITNSCGDGFLNGARVLNVSFFVLAGLLIFIAAKRICGSKAGGMVFVLSILAPINTYTAYFMPESLYFCFFWIFTLYLISLDDASSMRCWGNAGFLLGCTALVKPHALFLIPAIVIYILLVHRPVGIKKGFGRCVIFIIVLLIAKFAIGYLLAGKAGLTFCGSFYSAANSQTRGGLSHYVGLLKPIFFVLKGHILANSFLLGLPLAAALYYSLLAIRSKIKFTAFQRVSIYAVLILSTVWVFVSYFTASVVDSGYETVTRLHLRYYSFAFPLLLLVGVSLFSQREEPENRPLRIGFSIFTGALILFSLVTYLKPYTPAIVDCPELCGVIATKFGFWIAGILSLVSVVLWAVHPRTGSCFFGWIAAPAIVIISSFFANKALLKRNSPDAYDRAGMFAKEFLSKSDRGQTYVVGSDPASLYRALLRIDHPRAGLDVVAEKAEYALPGTGNGKKWILLIGDHATDKQPLYQIGFSGFRLIQTGTNNEINFREKSWPGTILNLHGLYEPEKTGRWSSGKTVTIEFMSPLPEKFKLDLVARPFGPNEGKETWVHVGDCTKSFILSSGAEHHVLEFQNPRHSNVVQIDIPIPCSPSELGVNDDRRTIGVMFTSLHVESSE